MPYQLSDDEALIQQTVRSFAQGIGLERAADMDRHDRPSAEVLQEGANLGLCGLALPPEQGGAGPSAFALAVDEVAQVCPNTAALLAVQNQAVAVLAAAGAPAEMLQAAASGTRTTVLAAEEATGSNSLQPNSTARRDGDGWSITGQKVWGLGAAVAQQHLVLAQATDGEASGPTLFLVPAAAPGVGLSRPEAIMGLRASGIRTVYLSGVKVEDARRVGAVGEGARLLRAGRAWLQVGCAAALGGCIAGALAAATAFAQSRVQFGQPIASYQAVSDTLANADVTLHAARSLTLAAAARLGLPEGEVWAARAKAFAVEGALVATRQAIRVQGGTGFMREGGTERFARDARALQFVGEPAVVQRDTVRRALLDIELAPTP